MKTKLVSILAALVMLLAACAPTAPANIANSTSAASTPVPQPTTPLPNVTVEPTKDDCSSRADMQWSLENVEKNYQIYLESLRVLDTSIALLQLSSDLPLEDLLRPLPEKLGGYSAYEVPNMGCNILIDGINYMAAESALETAAKYNDAAYVNIQIMKKFNELGEMGKLTYNQYHEAVRTTIIDANEYNSTH